jgi:hypothetical protein
VVYGRIVERGADAPSFFGSLARVAQSLGVVDGVAVLAVVKNHREQG